MVQMLENLSMQKIKMSTWSRLSFLIVVLTPFTAGAWGKRGHQIVAENAALIASQEPGAGFLRGQGFNFGYYANVPDIIWKRPATYEMEKPQHFMDLEFFDREFAKHPDVKNPLELPRKEFEAKFPEIPQMAGRAYWRIRELYADLEKVTQSLRDLKEQSGKARQKLQEKWVVLAGIMGHYIGDLGQPLHVTENHDGQMTGQKGVHSYFEETLVDELYPDLNCEVNKEAKREWPMFTKKNSQKTVLELVSDLTARSRKDLPKLLELDKKSKRENVEKNTQIYHSLIRQRLVDSTLVLAELYRRQVGWTFDNNRFFFMAGEPEYIKP